MNMKYLFMRTPNQNFRLYSLKKAVKVTKKLFFNFAIFTGKHVLESLFNKVTGLQFLRTPILKNTCELLLSA